MISSNRFRQAVTIRRREGSSVNGRWVVTELMTFEILASIQPVTKANDFSLLPEGAMERGAYRLYTNTELITGDDGVPDVAILFGNDYIIHSFDKWTNGVFTHRKYFAIRESGV